MSSKYEATRSPFPRRQFRGSRRTATELRHAHSSSSRREPHWLFYAGTIDARPFRPRSLFENFSLPIQKSTSSPSRSEERYVPSANPARLLRRDRLFERRDMTRSLISSHRTAPLTALPEESPATFATVTFPLNSSGSATFPSTSKRRTLAQALARLAG